jgi:hypothetical protein
MITNRIIKLEQEANSLRFKFRVVFIILTILAIINIGFFLPGQLTSIQKQLTQNNVTTSTTNDQKTNLISKSDFQANINSFYGNTAISEIGYQLDLKKQSISTRNTTNCFTPTVPSIKNGCGFEIRPYAATIPLQGTKLLNIIFKAQIGQNDKIALDIKNSETGEITSSLGLIEGKFKELSLKLPGSLNQNEQILVRLWPQSGSEMTVDSIIIEYLDITKLQPIELKLSLEDTKKYVGKNVNIYRDKDKNGLFEKSTDLLWNCRDNFPGVKPAVIKEDGIIKLERDDECIKDNIPSTWKSDSGTNSLAPYYWIAVIKTDEDKNDTFAFQTIKGKEQYEINN